jgi:uncharacterized protein
MIVETIFSTQDKGGNPNFAPMGIVWGESTAWVRPFRDSQTCRNLLETRCGIANISDDVLAYVQSALYDAVLPHFSAKMIQGIVFSHACSWREMEVVSASGNEERAEIQCRVVWEGRQRDFLGFRRAGNAVIEATILATRMHFYAPGSLEEKLAQYAEIVEKTGDATEKQALQMIQEFIRKGA